MKQTLKDFIDFIKPYNFNWDNERHIEYLIDKFISEQPERLSEKTPKIYCGSLPDHPMNLKSTQYQEG